MSVQGRLPPANAINQAKNLVGFFVSIKLIDLVGDIDVYRFTMLNGLTNPYLWLPFRPFVKCIQYAAGFQLLIITVEDFTKLTGHSKHGVNLKRDFFKLGIGR